ncbi:uncharacterized [Tachysurus ichikawai]
MVLAFPGAGARDPSPSSEGRSFDSKRWSHRSLTWEDWGPNQAQVLIFTDCGSETLLLPLLLSRSLRTLKSNTGIWVQCNLMQWFIFDHMSPMINE